MIEWSFQVHLITNNATNLLRIKLAKPLNSCLLVVEQSWIDVSRELDVVIKLVIWCTRTRFEPFLFIRIFRSMLFLGRFILLQFAAPSCASLLNPSLQSGLYICSLPSSMPVRSIFSSTFVFPAALFFDVLEVINSSSSSSNSSTSSSLSTGVKASSSGV